MEHVTDDCTCEGKQCNGCEETLCIDKFYRRKKNNRLFPRCKECSSQDGKKKYQANREKTIQRVREYRQETGYDKKYYREHADHLKENTRLYYKSHRDEIRAKAPLRERAYAERRKAHMQAHREHYNELARMRREKNKRHYRAIQRAYYHRNPEQMKMYRQSYYQKKGRDYFRTKYSDSEWRERKLMLQSVYRNRPDVRERDAARRKAYHSRPDIRERWRIHASTRRARKSAVSGIYTPQQIQELLKRQRYRCYYCSQHFEKRNGKYIYHIDHTFPLSRVTGTSIPANDISYLVLACPTCNVSKGDKFPWEWPEGGKLL